MKLVLASAPHRDTFGYSMPPPGLLRLGAALRDANVEVRLDDLAFRMARGELPEDDGLARAAAERLLRERPDALGLSTMGATVPIALAIAQEVRRERPELPILFGGPGVTGLDAALVERFDVVDVVVRGEGEITLPELARRLEGGGLPALAGLEGITRRGSDGAAVREPDRSPIRDLTALGEIAWELLPPLEDYKSVTGEDEGLAPIDSGRGCVFDCSFCTIGRFWERRSLPLPAATLAREVARLAKIPGARRAYLCHDIFGADRRHALEFCAAMERLARAGEGVPWECRARVDHLDDELLAAMGRAGCYRVLLGIESADEDVLARCNKGLKAMPDVVRTVECCAENGIVPILSLVLGLPGEDDAALARTLDLCARASLAAGTQLSLHLVNPQPGCGLGEDFGADARPLEGIPPDMALGTGATAPERELIEAHPDLFTTFALLPGSDERMHELHAIASALPELLMRYPIATALARHRLGDVTTLELFRAVQTEGRTFEGFVSALRDPATSDALRLEQARVRVAARGRPRPRHAPRLHGELVSARFDLPALRRALLEGEPELPLRPVETALFVAGGDGTTETARISAGLFAWMEQVDGVRSHTELTRGGASQAQAYEELTARGWIVPGEEQKITPRAEGAPTP